MNGLCLVSSSISFISSIRVKGLASNLTSIILNINTSFCSKVISEGITSDRSSLKYRERSSRFAQHNRIPCRTVVHSSIQPQKLPVPIISGFGKYFKITLGCD